MSKPLYHGTDMNSVINITEQGINISQNPKGGDFGVGFYLTPQLESAKLMALRKAYGGGKPGIIELTLNKNYKNMVIVKDFGTLNQNSSDTDIMSWAQFIVNNRNGVSYVDNVSLILGQEDNNIDGRYDIVIGTIADGSVSKISRKCNSEKRLISLTEAKEFLNKSFGTQYCICTKKGLLAINNQPREKKGMIWK